MEFVLIPIGVLVALVVGYLVGVSVANSHHKAARGEVCAATINTVAEIIHSEMKSQEFHMAVMSVVHPDAAPNDGYQQRLTTTMDADTWLAQKTKRQPKKSRLPWAS